MVFVPDEGNPDAFNKEQGVRKLIITIVAMLLPFGMWVAGCRDNRQTAAFPTTPEMKSIARSPEQDYATRPPVIPAAIDREILNSPDQPTFARIRAVMDRSEMLAAQNAGPGLFVLPPQDDVTMAYHQERSMPVQGGYVQAPVPTQVYQSEPVMYQASASQVPPPVAAPAPAGREFWSRPSQQMPPRALAPQAMPSDVSAMMPAALAATATDAQMMVESIPGVFMGSEDASLDAGWIGMSRDISEPPLASLPPALSSSSFDSVPAGELNTQLRRQQPWRPHSESPDLDLVAMLNPRKEPPSGREKLEVSERLNALLNDNAIRQALEPLPDISAMPLPPPAELSVPEARTAPATLAQAAPIPTLEPMPPPLAAPESGLESMRDKHLSSRDRFRMDIKEDGATPPALPALRLPEDPASVSQAQLELPTDLTFDLEDAGDILKQIIETAEAAPAPEKVTLQPIQPSKNRTVARNLSTIDANTAVPPLRF